jgi:hypothetical protein
MAVPATEALAVGAVDEGVRIISRRAVVATT